MKIENSEQSWTFIAYSDGACSGNPGVGGWGAVILMPNDEEIELSGFEQKSTNNRMELFAAISALEYILSLAILEEKPNIATSPRDISTMLYTDSIYVKNGITEWIEKWKKNGWKTAAKKDVKNVDLWIRLDNAAQKLAEASSVKWHWVAGHSGDKYNDHADKLARAAIALSRRG